MRERGGFGVGAGRRRKAGDGLCVGVRGLRIGSGVIAGGQDACLRSEVPAIVTRTDATTTIELELITGCDPTRYVIRNDGSGGIREVKRNERWVNDTFDHGLTLKK